MQKANKNTKIMGDSRYSRQNVRKIRLNLKEIQKLFLPTKVAKERNARKRRSKLSTLPKLLGLFRND